METFGINTETVFYPSGICRVILRFRECVGLGEAETPERAYAIAIHRLKQTRPFNDLYNDWKMSIGV